MIVLDKLGVYEIYGEDYALAIVNKYLSGSKCVVKTVTLRLFYILTFGKRFVCVEDPLLHVVRNG